MKMSGSFGKKIRITAGVLLLFVLFCLPALHSEAAGAYSSNGALSVKNGKIVNASGKSFVIKGVSTHGLAWYPEYVNKETFRTLRDDWGANTIRLALYTAEYNGYCTGGSQNQKTLLNLIDQGVKYATELGMYVIIDWHILSDGNPLTYQSQANTFFKTVAQKYANYGNVLYEICNEPNGSGGTWKNIKSYAKKVIKTIRSVDSDAIIIVGTPTWSQDVDQAAADPLTGYSNIAYAFHFYADTHKSAMRSKLEKALKAKLPVVVTEFGISNASGGGSANTSEGNKWIKLLDQYGVGRVCWGLSNKNETCSLLKSSCTRKSGFTSSDLSASGKWLVSTYTGKSLSTGTSSSGSSSGSSGSSSSSSSSSSSASSSSSSSGSSSQGKSQQKVKTSTGKVKLKATIYKDTSWKSGGKYYTLYRISIKNTGSKTSKKWRITVKMKQSFSLSDKWCGSFKKKGKSLVITPVSWNKKLSKNGTTELGFIVISTKAQTLKSIAVKAW